MPDDTTGTTGTTGTTDGSATGTESSLSTWVGPYVTDMLSKGWAQSYEPYQAYSGPLTAGESAMQQQAFSGLANLAVPTERMGTYTPQVFTDPGVAQQYMSPYLQAALEPQLAEARRQAQVQRVQNAARLTQAGAFGGGRQAVMESELDRNLLRNLADITGQGYQQAYTQGLGQFNTEQDRQRAAQAAINEYGLNVLQRQENAGQVQRDIEQAGVTADMQQFLEERDFPYKQVQYMQSLLQGLPVEASNTNYAEPSYLTQLLGGGADITSLLSQGGIGDLLQSLFGGTGSASSGGLDLLPEDLQGI